MRSLFFSRMSLRRECLSLRSGTKFGHDGLPTPRKLRSGFGPSIHHSAQRQVQAELPCSQEKEIRRRICWPFLVMSSFTMA